MLSVSASDGEYEYEGERRLFRGLAAVRDWCEGRIGGETHAQDRDLIRFPSKTVDSVSAGTRHMQTHVYAWGANFLDLEEFLEVVRTAPWRYPESVQVFAHNENDDACRFVVYNLNADRSWSRCPP
jgi:hypothetical protein